MSGSTGTRGRSCRTSPGTSLRLLRSIVALNRSHVEPGGAWPGALVTRGQLLAAPLHGGQELAQVDLEVLEDAVGVVLGAQPRLPLTRARLLHQLVGLALGQLHDLLLRGLALGLLARFGDQPLGLSLGLGQHLLALLDDPARLL